MNDVSSIQRYLDARLIAGRSDISSSKKLLQEMARLLALPFPPDEEGESREKDVYRALLEREKLGNTGIGKGIALPHSRYEHAEQAIIAIITLDEPIDYDSADKQPVDVAFGLLVPQQATQEHLRLLADIARMMSQEGNKDKLVSANDPQQIIDLIVSWSQSSE